MSILSKITFDNPRRSNPRFSVADAKVLQVFGIAKPIHYFFFEKSFKSGIFWEKTMAASEGRINPTNV